MSIEIAMESTPRRAHRSIEVLDPWQVDNRRRYRIHSVENARPAAVLYGIRPFARSTHVGPRFAGPSWTSEVWNAPDSDRLKVWLPITILELPFEMSFGANLFVWGSVINVLQSREALRQFDQRRRCTALAGEKSEQSGVPDTNDLLMWTKF